MYVFLIVWILNLTIELRHFRSISGFIRSLKFHFQNFLFHQMIRRKILGGVSSNVIYLYPHLVGDIFDLDPFVS